MFSFWSNDEDDSSDQSNETKSKKDKSGKPEHFRYVSKKVEASSSFSDGDFFKSNRSVKNLKEKRKQMDDMLKDVWSVRKNVRVNNAVKAIDNGQKSYYSRHGGASGLQSEAHNVQDTSPPGSFTKTWNIPRAGYSYSEKTSFNQGDILGENTSSENIESPVQGPSENHDPDIQRRNIVNSIKHRVTGPNVSRRELSARTKRAQKFNNAYLRSTGLGQYTPYTSKPSNHSNPHNKNWKS